MKSIYTNLLVLVLFFGSYQASASFSSLSGPTAVIVNDTDTYMLDNSTGFSYLAPSWTVTGGTVLSTWKTGVDYYASIKWTSTGNKTVTFKNASTTVSTLSVNVSAATVNPGSISASTGTTVCINTNPGNINNSASASSGNGSYSYQWQKSVYSGSWGSWTNLSGSTSTTYNPPTLLSSTRYRRKVTSGTLTAYTNTVTYTTYASLVGGNIGNAQSLCYNGNPSTLTNTGSATGGNGHSYQWQHRSPGGSWANISSATSSTYNPPALTSTKEYRRRVQSCSQTAYTNTITVTIYSNLSAGSIGNVQTVCYNGDPSTLTNSSSASGSSGTKQYQWQYSTNGSSGWTNISGATSTTYNPGTLTSSRWYRRRVRTSTCSAYKYTGSVKVTVNPALNAGSISNAQTLCYNGNPSTLSSSSSASGGNGNYLYQWQHRSPGGSWSNISSATSTTYNPPALTSTKEYRRKAVSCGQTKYSGTVTVTIYSNLSAGSIGNAQSLCYNGNPSTLTNTASASGSSGTKQYQWQYSTNGSSGWTNISGATSTTYNPGALTSNRWYRRRVRTSTCSAYKYTNSVKVTIYSNLNAGSIGNAQTLCYNGNPSTLTNTGSASGSSGTKQYQWQYSTNGSSGWTNISGATSTTYNPGALTSNRWYRRRVRTSTCSAYKYTGSVKVTIYSNLNAGSIGNAQTLCYNGNPSTLTNTGSASGSSGTKQYQWQYSTNGSSGWTNISGATSTTYDPGALSSSRWYRRRVRTSTCSAYKYTSSVKVTIHSNLSAGSIGNAQSLCYNGDPSTLTSSSSASGSSGTLQYQWQYSTNGISGWSSISGATSTTYNPGALTSSRWYRRRVRTSTCSDYKYTSSVKVTIYSNLSAGSIGNAQTLCYNGNPSALSNTGSAFGSSGSMQYQWQYSTNGSSSWTNISGATSATYDPGVLTADRWYRRRVRTSTCSAYKYTGSVKVTVHPNLSAGSISNAQTLCFNGNPATLTSTGSASGGDGSISYQWQSRPLGGSWSNVSSATSTTYNPGALTSSREYRRRAISCGLTKYTGTVTVTIHPSLAAGGIGNAQTVCYNGNPSALTNTSSGSGGDGSITYQWESRAPGGSWSSVSGATSTTYDPGTLTSTKEYRRKAVSCGQTLYTGGVTVTVQPILSAGSIGNAQSLCYSGNPSTLTNTVLVSGGNGSYSYQWQSRPTGGSWSNVSGATSATYNPPSLTSTKEYKRNVTSCGQTMSSNTITVTVHPDLTAGSINNAQTLCYNGNPATLGSASGASGGDGSISYQWESKPSGGSWSNISGATSTTYNPGNLTTTTEYRRKAISCGQTKTTGSIAVTIQPDLVAGTLTYSGGDVNFGAVPALINGAAATGGDGNVSYVWESKIGAGNFSAISGATAEDYQPISQSEEVIYRRETTSCGQTKYTNEVTIGVVMPNVSSSNGSTLLLGENSVLSVPNVNGNTYQWYKDGEAITGQNNASMAIYYPGDYHAEVTAPDATVYSTSGSQVSDTALEQDENFVKVRDYRVPVDGGSQVMAIGDVADSFSYFDGLGRSTQQVQVNNAPNLQDVIVPVYYDAFGRQLKQYRPYVDGQGGVLKSNAIGAQATYYQNSVYSTDKAFAEQRVERSPRGRIEEQGNMGDDWQIGENTVTYTYELNSTSEVILWNIDSVLTGDKEHYNANALYKNTVTDEDGNPMVEYTDKLGKTILKKSFVSGSDSASTYYIYDHFDRLVYVIPPEATARLTAEFFAGGANRQSFLDTWTFQYAYDGYGRMTSKQVPGAEKVLMVYDRWDRLVLTQDGNQRAQDDWLFTKYDRLDRPIMTGIVSNSNTEASVRSTVAGATNRYDSLVTTETNQYSNGAYPTANIDKYLTVTYYDKYTYQSHADWSSEGLGFVDPQVQLTQQTLVNGLVTGTMTKAGDGTWIRSVSYYDDRYRPIQGASTNHLGGKDVVTNYYDFVGQVLKTISSHGNGVDTTTLKRTFTYDHVGRLETTWHQVNNEDSVQIVENNYNELGELIEKDLHAGEQSVDYSYNIRGWLTSINNAALTGSDGDLFGMELFYNESSGLSEQETLYNGNISAVTWSDQDRTGSSTTARGYTYAYDQLNRLTAADHFENGITTPKYGVSDLDYDLNGNILGLARRSTSTSDYMDSLTYSYGTKGNQLQSVSDASLDSLGFYDGNTSGADYEYDDNGNMVKDRNKAIDSIYYNHLNLPILVDFVSGGDSIEYLYDAAGIKLQQVVYEAGDTVKVTDYVGEFIYETEGSGNRELQLIQHEEGRIVKKSPFEGGQGDDWDYQYHLKDHLGNTRLTFSTTPENYTQVAQFEDATQATDTVFFGNVNVDRVPHPLLANTGKAARLNSTNPAGPFAVLRVNKGDTVDLSVKAYYDGGSGYSSSLDSAAMVSALVTAFGTSKMLTEGGITNGQLQVGIGSVIGLFGVGGSSDDAVPGAYLNYMVFDLDMNYVGVAGFDQISSAADGAEELVERNNIEIEQEGYLIAYLSNESNSTNYVHFDDFTIYHGKTNVVQSDDYYPFGLAFNSYSRNASTPQNFKYSGKEELADWGKGVMDFDARFYNAGIGRFMQIDPMAERRISLTPYNFVQNNPLLRIDPTGMTDFKFDKDSGMVTRADPNDDSDQDDSDQIVKTDKDGNVKKRGDGFLGGLVRKKKRGKTKTHIAGIAKGILKHDQNFLTTDQRIDVNGAGQPSTDDVTDFVYQLSSHIGKEISGGYYSPGTTKDSPITKIVIDEYNFNERDKSNTNLPVIDGLHWHTHFHTHLPASHVPGSVDTASGQADGSGDTGYIKTWGSYYKRLIIVRRTHGRVEELQYWENNEE